MQHSRSTIATLGLLLLALGTACSDPYDHVRARTWNTVSEPELFPERTDPELAVPWLPGRPSFGIAFSGGGNRSAAATLGQLRALQRLGWIDRARYISANSGGSWTATPYTFLPESFDEQRFLGAYVPPEEIDDAALEPPEDPHGMASAIFHSRLADLKDPKRLLSFAAGDEMYANLVGRIFLEPFGLHDRQRFFTFHEAARDRILAGNPALKPNSFYLARRGRPFLIVVGTLLGRQMDSPPEERFLFEVTPLYVGVRQRFEVKKSVEGRSTTLAVGGGYLEPFGYDSYAPTESARGGRVQVRLKGKKRKGDAPTNERYRFTLSDVIGMSSAAPLVRLTRAGVPNLVFPEFRHWAVDRDRVLADDTLYDHADELQHGDGGDIDNLALLPLLARGVKNALVFVNTSKRFSAARESDCDAVTTETMVDDVISLFRPVGELPFNTVFAGGDEALGRLCRAFLERRATGEPLVHCETYEVVENARQGVRPYRPAICLVYLDRAENWVEKLIPDGGDETSELASGSGDFDNFPHYRTFGEHGVEAIDLDRERVHALSNLTAWTVLDRARDIAAGLPGADLPEAGLPGAGPETP